MSEAVKRDHSMFDAELSGSVLNLHLLSRLDELAKTLSDQSADQYSSCAHCQLCHCRYGDTDIKGIGGLHHRR